MYRIKTLSYEVSPPVFTDFRLLILWFILLSGCECCCNKCDSYSEGTVRLELSYISYPSRQTICPIPVTGGDVCLNEGENIISFSGGASLDSDKYLLYVEYITRCKDFQFSQAISNCTNEGTCIAFSHDTEDGCNGVLVRIGLNIDQPNCTPSFPIPIPDDKEGQLAIKVYYREPCILVSDNCEAPSPCTNIESTYRPSYEGGGLITFSDNTEYDLPVFLMHKSSMCGISFDCN